VTGILIDTYAWIEIFSGSPWGRRALACIKRHSPQAISVLTLYELQYRLCDLYGEETTASLLATITANTVALPVDNRVALTAGAIKTEQKRAGSGMGAADCLILATSRIHRLKILTGDRHFAGLKETIDV
jgi:predicted nucleic acid-binding protein